MLGAWSVLVFAIGGAAQKTGFFGDVIRPILRTNVETVGNYLHGRLSRPVRLEIDLGFEELRRLQFHRERALSEGSVFATDDSWVPARIRTADDRVDVRMRLKGDAVDHLQGDKWSFRLDVRGGRTLFGMRRFSLQHPATRNDLSEWIYHRAMLREGIIGLRYEFIEVTLNGESLGVYALEEHFDKQLIEHNRRREGPILRFDEELMWRQVHDEQLPYPGAETAGTGEYVASGVDGFRTGQALADPVQREQYLKAAQLLESFRNGELSTSETFDTGLLAKYFALVDLLGAEHGSRWHNIRFYYNPITTRLEPVAFDAQCSETLSVSPIARRLRDDRGYLVTVESLFHDAIFRDERFMMRYLGELERVADPAYLDSLFAEIEQGMKNSLAVLHREFPHLRSPEPLFRRNQAYLRRMLDPVHAVRAFVDSTSNGVAELRVGNLHALPIQVRGIDWGAAPGGALSGHTPLPPHELPARPRGEPVVYQSVTVPLGDRTRESWDPETASLVYGILGTRAESRVALTPHPAARFDESKIDLLRRTPNTEAFPFLGKDTDTGRLVVASGKWKIESDLIVPPGWTLAAGPGTRLELTGSARLLSYSPLELIGTASQPVQVVSATGSGSVIVMQAGARSRLEHVRFEGLGEPNEPGLNLTGAVTFYESPVSLAYVEFNANEAEDSLNVVRTEFVLEDVTFRGATSDAFDADFCQGRISNCRFFETGNDAIDVSGSTIEVDNVLVQGAGDKGISTGEASDLVATHLDIRGANLALASKDRSTLIVSNATLRGCEWSVAAFQKKSEFGPAVVRIEGFHAEDMEVRHLIERGSSATIDDVELPIAGDENIKAILYDEADDAAPR